MHPYRDPPVHVERPAKPAQEELVLYVLLAVIGTIPVLTTLTSRARFGVEATLGLLMVIAGIAGGVVYARRLSRSR